MKKKQKKEGPVVKAFWSCPLKPVAHGLTVITTLFLLKKRNPKVERNINIEPPTTPDNIKTVWCFLWLLKLGIEEGEEVVGGLVGGGKIGSGRSIVGDGAGDGDSDGENAGDGGNEIDEVGNLDGDGDGDGDCENCNSFLSVASLVWITFL